MPEFITKVFIFILNNFLKTGMIMKTCILLIVIFFSCQILPQSQLENKVDIAYQNAKKGIYWSLNNIPESKSRLKHDLIDKDKLYSTIQIVKEIDGVKIISTGFNNSAEVRIKIYISFESLIKDGYIKDNKADRETDTTKLIKKQLKKRRKN